MHCALYHPVIPQNTGNIGRLCVGMGATLHIIGPCAFTFDDRALKRAGLDYWQHLQWQVHDNEEAFVSWLDGRDPWLITKFGQQRFDQAPYHGDDIIVLGNENSGLPDSWHQRWPQRCLGIPIMGPIRSYNLANAAAMVLSHASAACGCFDDWTPMPR